MFETLAEVIKFYSDTPECHTTIWNEFLKNTNTTPILKQHRDWVETNMWGYGERQFHYMWNLIVKELPQNFKALEIGVFKGQIVSLLSLLNREYEKHGIVFGITPLRPADDKFSKHPDIDYNLAIATIYKAFALDAKDFFIIEGLSNEDRVIELARRKGPFDVLYVDGNHNYDIVCEDIDTYVPLVESGGFIVMDDASNYLTIPDHMIRMNWKGLMDVSNAVRDHLENRKDVTHLLAVGHNRIWRKE